MQLDFFFIFCKVALSLNLIRFSFLSFGFLPQRDIATKYVIYRLLTITPLFFAKNVNIINDED